MAVNMELELRRAQREQAELRYALRDLWQQLGAGEKMIFLQAHPEHIKTVEKIDAGGT